MGLLSTSETARWRDGQIPVLIIHTHYTTQHVENVVRVLYKPRIDVDRFSCWMHPQLTTLFFRLFHSFFWLFFCRWKGRQRVDLILFVFAIRSISVWRKWSRKEFYFNFVLSFHSNVNRSPRTPQIENLLLSERSKPKSLITQKKEPKKNNSFNFRKQLIFPSPYQAICT